MTTRSRHYKSPVGIDVPENSRCGRLTDTEWFKKWDDLCLVLTLK